MELEHADEFCWVRDCTQCSNANVVYLSQENLAMGLYFEFWIDPI